jgi:hypothetical protein
MSDVVPKSPYGVFLRGRKAIARYHLQDDSPQAIRRVAALLSEVREENRLPSFRDGDGRVCSFSHWIDGYVRERAKHLPTELVTES